MSLSRRCDPEPIFELADGSLGVERVREVRAHLGDCEACRSLYERELQLNASLGSLDLEPPKSVCPGVAMALPTRSFRARVMWAVLAVMLFLTASAAMLLEGSNLAVLPIQTAGMFLGFVASMADMVQVVFAILSPALLVALAVGAVVDLAIAAVYLTVYRRRRAREA